MLTGLMALLFCGTLVAQNANKPNRGFAFGFHLNEYQNDFGFGLNITSPLMFHDAFGIRLRSSLMFNQNPINGESTWMPYGNITLGFMGVGAQVSDHFRLYGEGGLVCILPNADFSSQSQVFGGYGLFGFEFYFARMGNYFIEIGGMGTGAKADKIPTSPIYSNGMSISTGFRFVLPGKNDERLRKKE